MMRRSILILVFLVLVLAPASAARAQQRPLVTEDPETVGTGRVLVETGVTWSHDRTFSGSGLTGNFLEAPQLGFSVGVGPIAEIQVDGNLYERLSITSREPAPLSGLVDITGDSTRSIGDLIVGTKVRLVSEKVGRPGVGLRMVTKLPNASHRSGLGLKTMDFFATILVAKTSGSTRMVANAGLGILSDPTQTTRQTDVLLYGFSLARAIAQGFEVVGEINGHAQFAEEFPPPGAESHGVFRVGARYTRGPGRVDAGLLIGTTANDPAVGFTVGYTHVFNAFTIP